MVHCVGPHWKSRQSVNRETGLRACAFIRVSGWNALGFLGYDWIAQFKPKELSSGKLPRKGSYLRGTRGKGPGRQGRLLITKGLGGSYQELLGSRNSIGCYPGPMFA